MFKRFLAAVLLGGMGMCLLCLALITGPSRSGAQKPPVLPSLLAQPSSTVAGPIHFIDINPDNEDAGKTLCVSRLSRASPNRTAAGSTAWPWCRTRPAPISLPARSACLARVAPC
jgi:hypothetical protein